MDAITTFMLVVTLFHQGATSHPTQVYEPPGDAAVIDVYVSARRTLENHNDATASQAFLWLWDHALKRDPAAHAVRAAAAQHLESWRNGMSRRAPPSFSGEIVFKG